MFSVFAVQFPPGKIPLTHLVAKIQVQDLCDAGGFLDVCGEFFGCHAKTNLRRNPLAKDVTVWHHESHLGSLRRMGLMMKMTLEGTRIWRAATFYTQTDSEVILSTNQTKIHIDKIRVKLASKLTVHIFQHQL